MKLGEDGGEENFLVSSHNPIPYGRKNFLSHLGGEVERIWFGLRLGGGRLRSW